jgi:PhzF family phenazine biosynthesis protein
MLALVSGFASKREEATMQRAVDVFQVDAFTSTRFTGNPAGVVLDADGLSDAQMLAIARELNNADTAFVLDPTDPDHDIRVRFFTPRTEAAFVGHATLAVHAVLAKRAPRDVCRQAGKSGIVEVTRLGDDKGFSIRQTPAPLGREPDGDEIAQVLKALGLSPAALDPRCPPRIAGGASTRLLLGLASASSLTGLNPDLATLATLSALLGSAGYFIFSLSPTLADCQVESRMFCPALGIPEDPVSGNAHGMLGVYLWSLGLLPVQAGRAQFVGAQGHYLGRPGRVGIALDVDANRRCTGVHISGQAVQVFQTQIEL